MKKAVHSLKTIFCMVMVALLTVAFVPAVSAKAATAAPVCAKSQNVYIQKSHDFIMLQVPTSNIYVKNLTSKAKITNLKSSNKNIVPTFCKDMNGKVVNPNMIRLEIAHDENGLGTVKNGDKAKITFTVKQNSKTYKLSCNVIFKTAVSPFKVLSVRTETFAKNYASAYKGYAFRSVSKPKGSKLRISITPSAGHKIEKITAVYGGKTGLKTVKDGSWISMKDLQQINVLYSVTKKPANYRKPAVWNAMVPSPLHDVATLFFE